MEEGETMRHRPADPHAPFARRLKRLVAESGMSQERVAERAGLCQQSVSGLVRGRNEPYYSTLLKLHRALGCTWEELMGE
jgi:transcriptional regulator with XRE-family HTH domain